jgi:hypothetical protein
LPDALLAEEDRPPRREPDRERAKPRDERRGDGEHDEQRDVERALASIGALDVGQRGIR